jgi:hypothetical protein
MEAEGVLVVPGPPGIHLCNPLKFLTNQPEFLSDTTLYVLGAFGALANPSSFHHPDVRFVRRYVYDHMVPHIRKMFPGKKIELLLDRVSIRKAGTTVPGEKWHRDICETKPEGDIILGGWVNLDPDDTQEFSCVPGTHTDPFDSKGFCPIKNPEEYKAKKVIYPIKPGEVILFHQNIVHEIKSKKYKKDSRRLYIGWRITDRTDPLFDHSKVIEEQGVPYIPSGQLPPIYAKLHMVNHKQKVIDFSKTVHPGLLGPNGLVIRYLPSLKQLGVPLWPPYTRSDLEILRPM